MQAKYDRDPMSQMVEYQDAQQKYLELRKEKGKDEGTESEVEKKWKG